MARRVPRLLVPHMRQQYDPPERLMGSSTSYVLISLMKSIELCVLKATLQSRAAVAKIAKALFMLIKKENTTKMEK